MNGLGSEQLKLLDVTSTDVDNDHDYLRLSQDGELNEKRLRRSPQPDQFEDESRNPSASSKRSLSPLSGLGCSMSSMKSSTTSSTHIAT